MFFKVHHVSEKAEKLLHNFFVRKAVQHRALPYTFKPDGFYRKFKGRAQQVLKDVDYHSPSARSKQMADFCATSTIVLAIAAVIYRSWILIIASGIVILFKA